MQALRINFENDDVVRAEISAFGKWDRLVGCDDYDRGSRSARISGYRSTRRKICCFCFQFSPSEHDALETMHSHCVSNPSFFRGGSGRWRPRILSI